MMANEEGAKKVRDQHRLTQQPCPICKEKHSYKRKVKFGEVLEWPSERLENCTEFVKMTPQERGKRLQDEGGCCICTNTRHPANQCFKNDSKRQQSRRQQCPVLVAGAPCGKPHHKLLHGSASAYCSANSLQCQVRANNCPRPDLFPGEVGEKLLRGTQ